MVTWCITASSHYLNQCWLCTNLTPRNKFQWNFIKNLPFCSGFTLCIFGRIYCMLGQDWHLKVWCLGVNVGALWTIDCFGNRVLNSLWPRDMLWRHRSGSTLAQVMACCLMAPSHSPNKYWLIINGFCGQWIKVWYHEANNDALWSVDCWESRLLKTHFHKRILYGKSCYILLSIFTLTVWQTVFIEALLLNIHKGKTTMCACWVLWP